MVISEQSLSMWDLGLTGNQLPAEHIVTIPRAQVASIVDTGKTEQGGVPVARLTFADGSFADQRLISKPAPSSGRSPPRSERAALRSRAGNPPDGRPVASPPRASRPSRGRVRQTAVRLAHSRPGRDEPA